MSNENLLLNAKGLALIKESEGFKSRAYLDTGGVPTIGYGTTRWSAGKKVKLGDVISEKDAEKLLLRDIKSSEESVRQHVLVELNENQFSALVSWTYNLGAGNLKSSTLLKKVNKKDFHAAAEQILRWVYDNGKIQPGLITRRSKEASLFLLEE